jgi:hypothetical protein
MSRREDQRKQQQTTKWYVHTYIHADDTAVIPLGEAVVDGPHFSGKRHHGYGEVEWKYMQMIDRTILNYSRLEGAGMCLIELVTPFVVASEYPEATDRSVLWLRWIKDRDDLRLCEKKILEQREVFRLETVEHRQIVTYLGDCPLRTVKNGFTRTGSHSRDNFGKLRLKSVDEQYHNSKRKDWIEP